MKKFAHFIKSKLQLIAIVMVSTIIGSVTTAIVSASIPDSNGVIRACRTNLTGGLRIIDSASQSCTGLETPLNWDQYNPVQGTVWGDLLPLANTDASGIDLSFRNMAGSNLTNTLLQSASLSRTNFSNSNMTGAALNGVNADHVNFTGATLTGANLSSGSFTSSNFNSAAMSGLAISDMSFAGSSFSGTNLSNASFTNVILNGSTGLNTATLTGVTWSNTYCPDGTLSSDNGNTCSGHLNP